MRLYGCFMTTVSLRAALGVWSTHRCLLCIVCCAPCSPTQFPQLLRVPILCQFNFMANFPFLWFRLSFTIRIRRISFWNYMRVRPMCRRAVCNAISSWRLLFFLLELEIRHKCSYNRFEAIRFIGRYRIFLSSFYDSSLI